MDLCAVDGIVMAPLGLFGAASIPETVSTVYRVAKSAAGMELGRIIFG